MALMATVTRDGVYALYALFWYACNPLFEVNDLFALTYTRSAFTSQYILCDDIMSRGGATGRKNH